MPSAWFVTRRLPPGASVALRTRVCTTGEARPAGRNRMKYGTDDAIEHRSRAAEAHELGLSIQNDKAVQIVAGMATNLDDCLELLAMLGLDPHGRPRVRSVI
jgi:hypothetical protein